MPLSYSKKLKSLSSQIRFLQRSLSAEKSAPPSPSGFRLPTIAEIFRITTGTVTLLAALIFIMAFYDAFSRSTVTLEPIVIPETLQKRGFTSEAMTMRFRAQLQALSDNSETRVSEVVIDDTPTQSLQSVSVSDSGGNNLNELVNEIVQNRPNDDYEKSTIEVAVGADTLFSDPVSLGLTREISTSNIGRTLSIDVLGQRASLESIAVFFRELFQLPRTSIFGEVACSKVSCADDIYLFRVQTVTKGHFSAPFIKSIQFNHSTNRDGGVETVMKEAAVHVLKNIDPLDAAEHFINRKQYGPAKKILHDNLPSDNSRIQARTLLLLGNVYSNTKEASKAISLFHAAKLYGTDPHDVHTAIGQSVLITTSRDPSALFDPRRAVEHFEKAEQYKPGSWFVPMGRAYGHAVAGERGQAVIYAQESLRRQPTDPNAYFMLGLILDDAGDCQGGWDAYVTAANRGDARAQAIIGNGYADGGYVEPDDVAALMWLRLAAAQGEKLGYNGLGHIYSEGAHNIWPPDAPRMKDNDKALTAFRKAIKAGHKPAYVSWANVKLSEDGLKYTDSKFEEVMTEGIEAGVANAEDFLLYAYARRRLLGVESQKELSVIRLTENYGRAQLFNLETIEEMVVTHAFALGGFALDEVRLNLFTLIGQPATIVERRDRPDLGNDLVVAFRLFQLASETGSNNMPFFYGALLAHGVGDKAPDPVAGLKWIYIGEERKNSAASDETSEPNRGAALAKQFVGERIKAIEQSLSEADRQKARAAANAYLNPPPAPEPGCGIGLAFPLSTLRARPETAEKG